MTEAGQACLREERTGPVWLAMLGQDIGRDGLLKNRCVAATEGLARYTPLCSLRWSCGFPSYR